MKKLIRYIKDFLYFAIPYRKKIPRHIGVQCMCCLSNNEKSLGVFDRLNNVYTCGVCNTRVDVPKFAISKTTDIHSTIMLLTYYDMTDNKSPFIQSNTAKELLNKIRGTR